MKEELLKIFSKDANIDNKSVELLANALVSAKQNGFDYLELRIAIENLIAMKMDPITSLKSAFITGKTVGLTKERLIDTLIFYKNTLVKEKDEFEKVTENQQNQRIAKRLEQINTLKNQIAEKKALISSLEKEIQSSDSEISSLDFDIQKDLNIIDEAKLRFENAHGFIIGTMNKDLSMIEKEL
jgi:predicted RNase H-like nuclease (RuvC/YqgF family)